MTKEKKESLTAFVQRVSGKSSIEEGKTFLEESVELGTSATQALQNIGSITIVFTDQAILDFTLSQSLQSLEGMRRLEKVVQGFVTNIIIPNRERLVDEELNALKRANQEEPNGPVD